jgi:hypothetical protein
MTFLLTFRFLFYYLRKAFPAALHNGFFRHGGLSSNSGNVDLPPRAYVSIQF